ncbi:MAG: DUF3375 family protein [Coriobacteriales bacterium]|nr:DUF3375 family protein [Coriobacteriales bacterium]
MSDVITQYGQLDSVFADGAMRLLRSGYAQVSVALLRSLFAEGTSRLESEILYAQMDAMLDELEFADCRIWRHDDGTRYDAREVVNDKWVREFKLLERRILPSGESEHSLRPVALAVMSCIDAIANDTIVLSSPRVEMIVEALTKLSTAVNPDPEAQRADLVAKVEQAQRALDEFDASGGKLPDDLDPIAMYRNALDLMSQVPVDMSRIEEMMYEERNNLIDSFHADNRPGGELIAEYLQRSDDLFSGTDSGQVYNGAIKMLSNRSLNAQITARVRMITRSEALDSMDTHERSALERAWKQMVEGMHGVLKLRRSCSETVANAITQYDHDVYREYTALLKELYRVVLERGKQQTPLSRSPMLDCIGNFEAETIKYKLSAQPAKQPPPALFEADRDTLPTIDLERLQFFSGTQTLKVLEALESILPPQGEATLSELFNSIGQNLRREVELTGLMHYAVLAGVPVEYAKRSVYVCYDFEGNKKYWEAPDMVVTHKKLEQGKEPFNVA